MARAAQKRQKPKGLSLSAYARQRGTSEGAIRKLRDAGLVVLHRDGSVNVAKSDANLAKRRTRGDDLPENLADARRRKLAAQAAVADYDLETLRAGTAPTETVTTAYAGFARWAAGRILALCALSKAVAGQAAPEARGALLDAVSETLTDLSGGPAAPAARAPATVSLAKMPESDLAAMKAKRSAEAMEIRLDVRRGAKMMLDDVADEWSTRLGNARSRLIGVPGSVAPLVEHATAAEARKILDKALREVVAELAWNDVTLAAMLKPGQRPKVTTEPARRLDALRRLALKPPPRMTVVQWADEHRMLASEAGAVGGRWDTSRVEVARGPMMAVTEPGVRTVSVMSCTQLLKSSLLENTFGFFAHLDPAPILLVEPTDTAVEAFSVERIAPMIAATPALKELVGDGRTRTTDSKIKFKRFPGGFLALAAAGSPTNLAMRPVRVVLLDEVDKYEPTKEGDPISLAEERTATFTTAALSIRACSPTLEETSRIARSYRSSDRRAAYVPCPHCQHEAVLDFFRHVDWQKDADGEHMPETAAIHCQECGVAWTEADRLEALRGIVWRQTRPFTCCGVRQDPIETRAWRWDDENLVGRAVCTECGADGVDNAHAGFHASKLHSPWQDMPTLARKWLESKDDPDLRQAFFNTQLGLPARFIDMAEASPDSLMARRENWGTTVPNDVLMLSVGVDTQSEGAGRFELEVVGWGAAEESWSLEYEVMHGDLGKPEVWAALDAYLQKTWTRADGRELVIQAVCIDSGGHATEEVYAFSRARLNRRIWAIKGASERGGTRNPVWPRQRVTGKYRRTFKPVVIGTNAAKDTLARRLALTEPGPGFCHFPADRDQGYFDQLTAEKLTFERRAGSRVAVWKPKPGRANEALDCRVYAYAALAGLQHHGITLERAARKFGAPPEKAATPPAQAAQPQQDLAEPSRPPARQPRRTRRVVQSSWMNKRY